MRRGREPDNQGANMFTSEAIARALVLICVAACTLSALPAAAQLAPQAVFNPLFPAKPSSSDNLIFRVINPNLGCNQAYTSLTNQPNTYRIKMENNHITIKFSLKWMESLSVGVPPPPVRPAYQYPTEAQIGRLPPGDYTLTTEGLQCAGGNINLLPNYQQYAFTVTDGRDLKTLPHVILDYSGHWYDPADPGWGVSISQDGRDNILATFFTYTADGKSAWYVFQPKWELPFRTQTADLWQTAKPPGTTSPPNGATQLITVGKASLTFLPLDKTDRFGQPYGPGTFNATEVKGKIIYRFGDGMEEERNIVRFGTR